jgi:hypothetical protein
MCDDQGIKKLSAKDMAMMGGWINKKGYHADAKAVRSKSPDMLTVKYYLQIKRG